LYGGGSEGSGETKYCAEEKAVYHSAQRHVLTPRLY
jgi:hypothetical protein